MAAKINSLHNPRIKDLVRLRDRRHREASRRFLVDGFQELMSALRSGVKVVALYTSPEHLEEARRQELLSRPELEGTELFEVDPAAYEKAAYGDRREGFIAVCLTPEPRSLSSLKGTTGLLLILDHIEKPGNLGAMLRTCAAAGVAGVILCDQVSDLYNPNAIRSSVGAVFSVPVVTASPEETAALLEAEGRQIVAAVPDADIIYTDQDWTQPTALVVGSEHHGVSAYWKEKAGPRVQIPMEGQVDSLNVSISAAILIYEAKRQQTRSR